MADAIRFDYAKMSTAAKEIREISNSYKNAAQEFGTSVADAIKNWEGESKDKMSNLIGTVDKEGSVMYLTEKAIPELLTYLADLLEANATQMASADQQMAEGIPNSLISEA